MSTVVFLLTGINSSVAHHGLDTYDTTQFVEFTGKVVEFRLMDPHSLLVVETQDTDGTIATWEVEGGSASGILNSGLSQEFLRSRPLVHIKGFRSRDGICAPRCRMAGEDFDFTRN